MIILIGMEKGGPGKTTIATNLAAMCVNAGQSTLLVDADVQRSASLWADMRFSLGKDRPITCVQKSGKVGRDITELATHYDVVLVDAGGRDSIELRQSLAICDHCVIPVRPSQYDVWTISRMKQLVDEIESLMQHRPHASILINAKKPDRKGVETRDTIETLQSLKESFGDDFGILSTMITSRDAFSRSVRQGKAVVELERGDEDVKANDEMGRLYQEVFNVEYAIADQRTAA